MKNLLKCMFAATVLGCTANAFANDTDTQVWKTVSASDNSTYAIKADGTLWGWGDNELGQLATGSTDTKCSSIPVQIGTDSNWKAAYGARGAGFFIKEDGTLWTTGSNESGLSGVGDGVSKHTELVQVGTDNDWASVHTSITWCNSAIAIKTDGTLWSWGSGSTFVLGHGKTTNCIVPTQVGTDNDWVTASVGTSHVLALKKDGSLWGWGFAPYHQLMNDSQNRSYKVPTRLGNETWTAVYAIDNASYGVKSDGTLWTWGDNTNNLLGLNSDMSVTDTDGSLENVQTPTQITAVEGNITALSGCEYVRVVVANGKVYAWGANANGGLGNGKGEAFESNNQYSYTPVEVALPEGSVPALLSSGQRFSALLTYDGKIYGWGSNRWGQMGNHVDDTKLTFCPSPVEMGVPAPPEPGDYTFDAQNIPSSLSDAVKIKMTGEWGTDDLQKLCTAIGANLGFPPVGNNTLITVDMTEVTFAPATTFYVSAGMQNAGIFKMCKALETVKFPTNESVANVESLREAFMNCESLKSCDVSMLTDVSNIQDAFYNTAITLVNMSTWANIAKSEDAFGKCTQLTTVTLPANFTICKYLFNSCTALRTIDWSLYEGETAPVIGSDAKVFQDLTVEQQNLITMMVPETVYESFRADATWENINLKAVHQQEEGSYYVDGNSIPESLADAKKIYLTGLWNSDAFKALSDALGNNTETTGNNVLELVDMSQAEIATSTNLNGEWPGALWGTQVKGIFQSCTVLAEVVMPEASQAANFNSLQKAFFSCEKLESIDLSGCTGLTSSEDAFYGCSALAEVALPGNFTFASGSFDRCNALTTIDWTSFEGTQAPAFKSGSLPSRGKQLTIIVPDAAYDSFVANASWNGYNIVTTSQSGVDNITATPIIAAPAAVYDLNGRYVTTLALGEDVNNLPTGLYIVGGRKVLVK